MSVILLFIVLFELVLIWVEFGVLRVWMRLFSEDFILFVFGLVFWSLVIFLRKVKMWVEWFYCGLRLVLFGWGGIGEVGWIVFKKLVFGKVFCDVCVVICDFFVCWLLRRVLMLWRFFVIVLSFWLLDWESE